MRERTPILARLRGPSSPAPQLRVLRADEATRDRFNSVEELRSVLNQTPVGIAVGNLKGEFLACNPALAEMLGYREEELIGLTHRSLTPAECFASISPSLGRLIGGSSAQEGWKQPFIRRDGRRFWTSVSINAVPLPDGTIDYFVAMVEDIDARETAEAALRAGEQSLRTAHEEVRAALAETQAANHRLAELDRAKSQFVSMVSHEFRTALTSVQGFSEMIRDDQTLEPGDVAEYAGIINSEALRLNRLISDMLDLDRIESGRVVIHRQALDLDQLLAELVAHTAAPAHVIRLEAGGLPTITADRDKLTQVVANLLSNAVKYSPGGGEVVVSSRLNEGMAEVSVTDSGLGIPESDIAVVFERFARVESHNFIKGSGLGLAITRQIVELHGGQIWVESELGVGSSFRFRLPIDSVPDD